MNGYIDSISIDAYKFSVFFTSERGISGETTINIPKVIMDSKKMNGDDDIWIILANGIEIAYTEKETNDSREISFSTPYTKEIRIIGTHVISDFENII